MSGFLGEIGGLFGEGAAHERVGNLLSDALAQAGGVQGLAARANQAGLGEHVQSWIGDGGNWPISPAEIERVFPPDEIEGFAQAHGIPAGTVTQVLSTFLPQAVDHATPDNDAPAADDANAGGGGFDFGGLAKRLLGA